MAAEQCSGAWLDGPERYLVREVVRGSYSSSVIVLRHVCWIDVWAEIHGELESVAQPRLAVACTLTAHV